MRRQEIAQLHPVKIDPQHRRNAGKRRIERHYHPVADHVDHWRSPRLDLTIGLDQREPIALPQVFAINPQAFGRAAQEHVAAQPVAPHHPRGSIAHRRKALQPQLQAQRQLLWRRVFLLLTRQHQRRFEVSQPSRHHQIVRRQFQPQRLSLFDIGQVLIDQIEDRQPPQINLLPPRQIEQQIKWPLPAVQLKVQRGVVSRRRADPLPLLVGQGQSWGVDQVGHASVLTKANSASRLAISAP